MKLKIAHVTATFRPQLNSAATACYHNARELARLGHAVTVFTTAPGTAPDQACAEVRIRQLRPCLRYGQAALQPRLLTALRDFDLVHLHYPFIGGAEMVRLATAINQTPLVVSFHNDLIGSDWRAPAVALYQRLAALLIVRPAARLYVPSSDLFSHSQLHRALPSLQHVLAELPYGVDTQRFHRLPNAAELRAQCGIATDHKILLFVAPLNRMHRLKGLEHLLAALRHLPANIRLLVVGDGDLRYTYEQHAVALGLADRVLFLGAVDHEHTPAYYSVADATVVPTLPPDTSGTVLLESLACSTPVVASNVPGLRTLVEHERDGLLTPPNDSPALAAALQRILSPTTDRQAMGRYGRARVTACYDWGMLGRRLEALYLQTLTPVETLPPILQERVR